MEGISDIKIIGIDEMRPPIIRKQPYIDIFFKLSHQAPTDWCKDFNSMLTKHPSAPKIIEKEGTFIKTWVRTPDEIVALLNKLKDSVAECTRQYIQRIELSALKASNENTSITEETGEQGRLNKIIASLDFDDENEDK